MTLVLVPHPFIRQVIVGAGRMFRSLILVFMSYRLVARVVLSTLLDRWALPLTRTCGWRLASLASIVVVLWLTPTVSL